MKNLVLLALLSVPYAILVADDTDTIAPSSEEARQLILQRAKAWMGDKMGDESDKDNLDREKSVLRGPIQKKKKLNFAFNQEVKCRFVEPSEIKKPGGKTPKFKCEHKGKKLKVKYNQKGEYNPGVWGEILSTRLFWALGFPADAVYPVRIKCENCPLRPWNYYKSYYELQGLEKFIGELEEKGMTVFSTKLDRREELKKELALMDTQKKERAFNDAIIEIKVEYPEIERFKKQGWSWQEFQEIVDSQDPSYRELKTQRDALALLAAFIQHADNKAEQQRLVCLDNKGESDGEKRDDCQNPVMMIQDLGFTFGLGWNYEGQDPRNPSWMLGYGTTADLKGFVENPIWSDPKACKTQVNYFRPTGIEADQYVSEEGRKFLADKLSQFISKEENVVELFTAGRVDELLVRYFGKGEDKVFGVQEWVEGFKQKALEIINHRCPPLASQVDGNELERH